MWKGKLEMQSTHAPVDSSEIVSEEIRLKLVTIVEQWLNENPALYKINWEDVSHKIASEGVFLLPVECLRIWKLAAYRSSSNEDNDSDLDEGVEVNGHYLSKVQPKLNALMPSSWNHTDFIQLPHVVDDAADPSFETIQSFHNRHFDDNVRFFLVPALNRKTKKVKSIIDAGPSTSTTSASFSQPDSKKPRLDQPNNGGHNFYPTVTKDSKSAFAEKVIGQQIQQQHTNSSSSNSNVNSYQQQPSNQYVPLHSSLSKPNKPMVYAAVPAPPRLHNNMPITQQHIQSQFPYRPIPGLLPQQVGLPLSYGNPASQAGVTGGRAPVLPAFQTLNGSASMGGPKSGTENASAKK